MNHLRAFEQMKSLLGNWTVQREDGIVSKVSYQLRCKDTVLVEDWQISEGITSLTMFCFDHSVLTATHYCPVGNRPFLKLVQFGDDTLRFETETVANIVNENDDHCQIFEYCFLNEDEVRHTEVFLENNVQKMLSACFKRID